VALLQAMYFGRTGTYFVFQTNDLKHFIVHLFLANGWWYAEDYSFNAPIWSISMEVPVYFFFFLTLRLVSRSAWVNIAILSAWLIARFAHVSASLLDCLGFFYLGGWTAILVQSAERTRHRNVIRSIVLGAVVAVPVALYASALYRHREFLWVFMRTYVPALVFVCAQPIIVGPFARKVIEAAGNMTYSSYLIHFPLQLSVVLIWGCGTGSIAPNSVGFLAAFMAATLAMSYGIYRYFEKPVQDVIRNRFPG
jgi:peptidoglycan/LPS O-acetylase OafA/YrhL